MIITPHLLGAYFKCPMKCWLLAAGEHPTGNTYAAWLETELESYRTAEGKKLIAKLPSGENVLSPRITRGGEDDSSSRGLKAAKWRLAIDVSLSANARAMVSYPTAIEDRTTPASSISNTKVTHQSGCSIESCLHAIERIPANGRGKPTLFIPIRFTLQNKIDPDTRMLLAFDALVFSKSLGRSIAYCKCIHGEKHTTQRINTSGMASRVQSCLKNISALLSGLSPPDHSLNRHCAECEFKDHCRKIATEKDDLSLLSNLSGKERQRLWAKGSYEATFLTRMRSRYGIPPRFASLATVLDQATNLVLITYAKVYYPTYTNGLKDIAQYLGFQWSESNASGLSSIVWRNQWEKTHRADLKQR